MQKKIWIAIIVIGILVIILGGVFWYLQKSKTPITNIQSNSDVQNQAQNQSTQPVLEPIKPEITASADGKFSAFINLDAQLYCNFHIVNNETKSDIIFKKVSYSDRGQTDLCDFLNIGSFSLDDKYIVIHSGTSPIHTFEIINTETKKTLATVQSSSMYGWRANEFIFSEPMEFKNNTDVRPWGSGEGNNISKIDLQTGEKVVLEKADSTHDYYLEINPDRSLVGPNDHLWVDVKIYPSVGGIERFSNPSGATWEIDYNGKLIGDVSNYENYK